MKSLILIIAIAIAAFAGPKEVALLQASGMTEIEQHYDILPEMLLIPLVATSIVLASDQIERDYPKGERIGRVFPDVIELNGNIYPVLSWYTSRDKQNNNIKVIDIFTDKHMFVFTQIEDNPNMRFELRVLSIPGDEPSFVVSIR